MKLLPTLLPLVHLSWMANAAPYANPVLFPNDSEAQAVDASPNSADIALADLEKRVPASCQAIISPIYKVVSSVGFVVFVNGASGLAKRVCKLEDNKKCEEYADIIQDGFNLIWVSGAAYMNGAAAVSSAQELINNSPVRREVSEDDYPAALHTSFIQAMGEYGFSYDSHEASAIPRTGLEERDGQPALVSQMVFRNLRHAGRHHDVAVHHYDDGSGLIHLPHAGQSLGNSTDLHKRFNGAGFKISYTSRPTTTPSRANEGSISQHIATHWGREADAGINELIGFVETGHKANFYWRIIPELEGFGTNYESVDVCGGMAEYL
ncbi:hypothetical protein PHISCL_09837 [Aspergillus sclerotialis]|uniref:Uncharacterized protein n=1 Tax=Aspergillus sclerotialis TaxID=2070753 RepID=A0A3A2Z972_9EURO|nr:hypothetical protein PHISCL_09837 [Aspergillus sclerotialis]